MINCSLKETENSWPEFWDKIEESKHRNDKHSFLFEEKYQKNSYRKEYEPGRYINNVELNRK